MCRNLLRLFAKCVPSGERMLPACNRRQPADEIPSPMGAHDASVICQSGSDFARLAQTNFSASARLGPLTTRVRSKTRRGELGPMAVSPSPSRTFFLDLGRIVSRLRSVKSIPTLLARPVPVEAAVSAAGLHSFAD